MAGLERSPTDSANGPCGPGGRPGPGGGREPVGVLDQQVVAGVEAPGDIGVVEPGSRMAPQLAAELGDGRHTGMSERCAATTRRPPPRGSARRSAHLASARTAVAPRCGVVASSTTSEMSPSSMRPDHPVSSRPGPAPRSRPPWGRRPRTGRPPRRWCPEGGRWGRPVRTRPSSRWSPRPPGSARPGGRQLEPVGPVAVVVVEEGDDPTPGLVDAGVAGRGRTTGLRRGAGRAPAGRRGPPGRARRAARRRRRRRPGTPSRPGSGRPPRPPPRPPDRPAGRSG